MILLLSVRQHAMSIIRRLVLAPFPHPHPPSTTLRTPSAPDGVGQAPKVQIQGTHRYGTGCPTTQAPPSPRAPNTFNAMQYSSLTSNLRLSATPAKKD